MSLEHCTVVGEHLWKGMPTEWWAQWEALASILTAVSLAMSVRKYVWHFIWSNNMKCVWNLRQSDQIWQQHSYFMHSPYPLYYFFSQKGREWKIQVCAFFHSNSILTWPRKQGYKKIFELANCSIWKLLHLNHCLVWFLISFRSLLKHDLINEAFPHRPI